MIIKKRSVGIVNVFGSGVNVAVEGGTLRLADIGAEGRFTFPAGMDFGALRRVRLRSAEVIPVTGRKWTATATASLASPIADVSASSSCVRYAKKRPAQCACPYEQRPGGCDDAHIW